MVFNPAGERGEGEEIVLVNPQIKRFSKKIVPFEEGCLSFPKIYADVMVTFQVPFYCLCSSKCFFCHPIPPMMFHGFLEVT